MSDEKKKVKDLATELNQSAKDVIAAAKELGIVAAKATTSSLSEAETARIRNHFAPASDKPEVIVRRRKRVDAPVAPVAPIAPIAEDAPAEAAAAPEAVRPESPAEAAAPPPAAKSKEKTPKSEPVAARIIQRPSQKEPVAPAPQAAPAVEIPRQPAEKTARSAAARPEVPAGQETAPEAPVQAAQKAKPASEPAKPEQPAAEAEAQPRNFARVVRPAVFSAEPERNAKGQAVSSAPVLAPRSESGDYGDGETRAGEHAPGQVRVISRPTEQAPRSARPADGQRPSRPHDGQRPPRPGGDGRPPRPGDGGRPTGPGGYAPRPAGPGGFAPRPAGPGGGAPFAPAGDSEQGRKKRQKGRRTVEFGGENRSRNDGDDAGWSKNSRRRSRKPREAAPLGGTQPVKAVKRIIKMEEFIRVADLAHQMALKSGEIIKVLFNLGIMATINQSLDLDTATLVAQEFGYEVEKVGFFEEEVLSSHQETDKEEDLQPRPPVVTIMGHVDHGKTSLLDAIRATSVVSGEAGGITQHIGAYHVTTKKGEIVFLDTPGHEAFTAMRARGAEITDIVVLVVAADDGVMEQTREAISHAKAANVPIMVAVNKMDKPEANPDRVKRELSEQGLVAEDWGGDTTFSYVSAKTREGLDDLLELLALQAEILELKANPDKAAVGHIVEAKLDKGRGALGTVLIQQGTLRLGDNFVCGVHSGRVRAMFNDQGKKVKEAGPSMPVEVQGFEGVPEAGEEFVSIADEKTARRIANARAIKQRERELAKESKVTLETFLARKVDDVEAVVLNLVVKADVQGSLEAITDALVKMSTEKVRINIMHGGTGAISESDVLLASASNAIIIGFNVRPTSKGKELAEAEKVDMRFYDIIYKLVEEIKSAMEGMLAPVSKEVFLGTAEVRETFSVPKVGLVAGCHVSDGKMVRNALARLLRDGVVVYTGKLASLRRFKDDMREVAKGYECGIGLENYNDVKVGDIIEAYEIVEEAAKL